ncbi:transcriptional regulator [Deinococcus piscis]|uniref:Transcriptional regulator n=1 Tax=Deinococcus piscis TaxID=394230 RepID=A0ABQ3KFJ0_9DEIO|nr:YafY family protein [Deinococcus piscis]GHG12824.1 transcriptional regulator [Deinococcus piscis]
MNRTDRLFALLLELRGSGDGGWVQAEQLAQTFNISVRTVYRDIAALNESGVPVVSLAGKGYRLMDGYFLPPLHFTPAEALMMTLGGDAVRGAFDAEYAQAAASALQKLEAALSDEKRTEVQGLREAVRIVPYHDQHETGSLRQLRGAVLGRKVVQFQYHKPSANAEQREVYPMRLVQLYGAWLLGAFDPARQAQRIFRLSRMDGLRVLNRTFTPDPAWRFGAERYEDRRTVTVRLLFDSALSRPLRERASYFQISQKDVPDGLEVTLTVRDAREVLPWILSWGAGVRVLEPESLRKVVREEARKILLT